MGQSPPGCASLCRDEGAHRSPQTGAPGFAGTFAILSLKARTDIIVSPLDEAALQDAPIEEMEFDAAETKELDKLAEETRKYGIPWEDLKAELGL